MELTFLGGARTVTGSRHLVDTGRARVLIDCGMFQGGPADTMRNRVPLGFDPKTLDAVVLTHAHLDHCGLLPLLVAQGFRGSIVCTAATAELARLVLLDSAKLQVEFAKRDARRDRRDPERAAADDEKAQDVFDDLVQLAAEGAEAPGGPDPEELLRAAGPEVIVDLDGPLYTEDEVDLTLSLFRPIPYDQSYEAAQGVHVTLLDAGHILGSALVRMQLTRPDGGRDTVILFSGDLGQARDADPARPDGRHARPTSSSASRRTAAASTRRPRSRSTCSPRSSTTSSARRACCSSRRSRSGARRTSCGSWIGCSARGGSRSCRCTSTRRWPRAPRTSTARIPRRTTRRPRALLAAHEAPLDFPGQQVVQNVEESHRIARAAPPYIIVASNGMLTGGRSVGHAEHLLGDPSATVLFVGYQGEGTLGGHLVRGADSARISGHQIPVRATVRSLDGFSAHADEPELLDWLGNFVRGRRPGDPGVPRDVYLVHGDPPAQAALLPKVEGLGFRTTVPAWLQTVSLD